MVATGGYRTMSDEPFAMRLVESIAADGELGSGSIIRLTCGHLLWCPLGPAEIGPLKTVYCAACICEYLDSHRTANSSAN
jgi:hypothetical protein